MGLLLVRGGGADFKANLDHQRNSTPVLLVYVHRGLGLPCGIMGVYRDSVIQEHHFSVTSLERDVAP